MASFHETRAVARTNGLRGHPATILAIGTANPPNVMYQSDYPDYHLRTTNIDHLTGIPLLSLNESFDHIGISDWNSIFWVAHPGGPAILDKVEAKLELETSKLSSSRHILSEYGNMWGASGIFVMDEMRKRSLKEGKATTGEGSEWGVLVAFGPGIMRQKVKQIDVMCQEL